MKIVRHRLRPRNAQRQNFLRPYMNHVVLILQNSLDHQKAFGNQQHPILLQQIGSENRIGDPRFIDAEAVTLRC